MPNLLSLGGTVCPTTHSPPKCRPNIPEFPAITPFCKRAPYSGCGDSAHGSSEIIRRSCSGASTRELLRCSRTPADMPGHLHHANESAAWSRDGEEEGQKTHLIKMYAMFFVQILHVIEGKWASAAAYQARQALKPHLGVCRKIPRYHEPRRRCHHRYRCRCTKSSHVRTSTSATAA